MCRPDLAVLLCALAVACAPRVDAPGGASSEADSGPTPPPSGEIYARCDHGACDDPAAACVQCGGASPCFDHAFCGLVCEATSGCPSAPNGAPVICHRGGCSIDCGEHSCPFDMDCIEFPPFEIDAHPICMWRGDP